MSENPKRPDPNEALRDIVEDFSRKESSRARKGKSIAYKRTRSLVFKRNFLRLMLVAAVVLFLRVILVAADRTGILSTPKYWVAYSGDVRPGRGLNECVGNLWEVRRAVDEYYAENGTFPASAVELYEGGYLGGGVVCPSTGRSYVFWDREGAEAFGCPNPEVHGVMSVSCDMRSGAPEASGGD